MFSNGLNLDVVFGRCKNELVDAQRRHDARSMQRSKGENAKSGTGRAGRRENAAVLGAKQRCAVLCGTGLRLKGAVLRVKDPVSPLRRELSD